MEVHRQRPTAEDEAQGRYETSLVDELAPNPLVDAARSLGRRGRPHFPMLDCVRSGSDAYEGEHLWLDAHEAQELLRETQRLRRICRREEFIHGLDADRVWTYWRGEYTSSEAFARWLDRIEDVLETAAREGYWVHLAL
jgi:hypothetical protein